MIKDKNKLIVYLDLVSGCNLAKLGDGPDESPTVMVGQQTKQNRNLGKNRGILKPSWAVVETKSRGWFINL